MHQTSLMSTSAATILAHLKTVDAEHTQRASVVGLNAKVAALKAYQQRRFSHTYADLLLSTRYGPASRFFLDELYGPNDFTQRDAQFARVVPAVARLFPKEVVDTVETLAELHALSEKLDSCMAMHLERAAVNGIEYICAWQATGREAEREKQIALTLDVAGRLHRLTRRTVIRNSLRLMRGAARAAGLGDLQRFLESGFDTFRTMNGAHDFVSTVASRERTFGSSLFAARCSQPTDTSMTQALAELP